MAFKLALLYNEILQIYILNERGRMESGPNALEYQEDRNSEELPPALKEYILKTYGKRNTELKLDAYCREVHSSELEDVLKGTKINIS
ncbi:MAG: hypothetical protein AABX04_00035 [Nanoarchaeota archaeon]